MAIWALWVNRKVANTDSPSLSPWNRVARSISVEAAGSRPPDIALGMKA
jgi:hypothetical protein